MVRPTARAHAWSGEAGGGGEEHTRRPGLAHACHAASPRTPAPPHAHRRPVRHLAYGLPGLPVRRRRLHMLCLTTPAGPGARLPHSSRTPAPSYAHGRLARQHPHAPTDALSASLSPRRAPGIPLLIPSPIDRVSVVASVQIFETMNPLNAQDLAKIRRLAQLCGEDPTSFWIIANQTDLGMLFLESCLRQGLSGNWAIKNFKTLKKIALQSTKEFKDDQHRALGLIFPSAAQSAPLQNAPPAPAPVPRPVTAPAPSGAPVPMTPQTSSNFRMLPPLKIRIPHPDFCKQAIYGTPGDRKTIKKVNCRTIIQDGVRKGHCSQCNKPYSVNNSNLIMYHSMCPRARYLSRDTR